MEETRTILVVNGDDFGLSRGTNLAIQSAFRNGILRSASLMPNGRAFEDAVRVAQENPGLGVGFHLTLVDEQCVAPVGKLGRLVDAGGSLPPSYRAFVAALLLRRFSLKHLRVEVNAQIEKVLSAGITPTHIDSHQHLHMFPRVLGVVLEAARCAGIKAIRLPLERTACAHTVISSGASAEPRNLLFRPARIQRPREKQISHSVRNDRASEPVLSPRGSSRRVRIAALRVLCRMGAKKLSKEGFLFADGFWGLSVSGNLTEPSLQWVMDSLQPGVNELMCHPGFSDEATAARYPWGYHWDEEAAVLCSESIIRSIEEQGIRLAGFRDAWDAARCTSDT